MKKVLCIATIFIITMCASIVTANITEYSKSVTNVFGEEEGIPVNFAVDLDNDGNEEIVVAKMVNSFNGTADTFYRVYIFNKNGIDITSTYFATEVKTQMLKKVFCEDFNGDGKRDLMFLTQGIDVHPLIGESNRLFLSNTENSILTEKVLPGVKDYAHEGSVGDIDNDGDLDILVITGGETPNCYFYINAGLGNFTQRILFTGADVRYFAGSCSLADLDNDGNIDLVLGTWANSNIPASPSIVIFGDGSGNFNFANRVTLPQYKNMPLSEISTYVTATYDINNDGKLDIIFGMYGINCYQFAMQILKNNGDRTFEDVTDTVLPVNHIAGDQMMFINQIFQCDINSDGHKDIVFGNISFYTPNGDATVPATFPAMLLASGDAGEYTTTYLNDFFTGIDVSKNFFSSALIVSKVSNGYNFVNTTLESSQFKFNTYSKIVVPTGTPSSGGGGCNAEVECSTAYLFGAILLILPIILINYRKSQN